MRKAQLLSLSEESVYVQLKGLLGDFTQPSTWWTSGHHRSNQGESSSSWLLGINEELGLTVL